jgi:hypothetical protein
MTKQWTFETAIDWIKGNFRWPGGFIRARAGYVPTSLDREAIQYLVDHQQFAWEG